MESAPLIPTAFQKDIKVENYFAAANRQKVLTHALDSLERVASIIILSGEEGSGKTAMCRMIEHEAPSDCSVIVFPCTVDSFEDVIRMFSSHLNIDVGAVVDRKSVEECQKKIVDHMVNSGHRLLVIFDEAENIYLATLERIRKLIDLLADAGAKIHVVFSGRPPFLENCEQLSICDFQYSEEFILLLEPLTREETGEYLKKCVESIPDIDATQIFTEKVVRDIYSLTGGNFRQINILGEEALQSPSDDSFLNDLLINIETEKKNKPEKLGLLDYLHIIKNHALLPWVGAMVLGIFAFLTFYDSDSDDVKQEPVVFQERVQNEQDTPPAAQITPKVVPKEVAVESKTKAEEIVQNSEEPEEQRVPDSPVIEIQVVEQKVEDVAREPIEEVSTSAVEKTSSEKAEVAQKSVIIINEAEEKPVVQPVTPKVVEVKETVTSAEVELSQPDKPVAQLVPQNISSETTNIKKEDTPLSDPVVILRPRESTKRKGEVEKKAIKIDAPEKPLTQVQDVVDANAHFTTDQLYLKRLAEGISWRAGRRNDKYTVQLMVLTSRTAEKNLKMMLERDDYRGEADNFFIFKNNKELQTIFVFYGEYPTISQARQAQNSLPQFLRVHKPYAISIKGAIAKISR